MTSPYVYTPFVSYQATPYVAPYYAAQQQPSPFIPDATLYPASPYSNPSSLPASPHVHASPLPSPNTSQRILFPGADGGYSPWDGPVRMRRPSWHGGNPMVDGAWLQTPQGHIRTRSFGDATYPYQQPPGMAGYWPPPQSPRFGPGYALPMNAPQFHIHPWLNGESQRGDFIFDLSSLDFAPLRYLGPGQTMLLSQEDLAQPATHPPITRLRITCDLIPQWPTELSYNPYYSSPSPSMPLSPGAAPPITLGDILIGLHKNLQARITHEDWSRLNVSQESAVTRAYTMRCRAAGAGEMTMRSHGVKRVDFLLERVRFKGLIRDSDGWEGMKLIVG